MSAIQTYAYLSHLSAAGGPFRRSMQAARGAFSLPPSMTPIGLRIRRSWRRRTGAAGVPRQEIIQVAPASLRVAVQGAGQPLLLLAGLGGGLDMWGPFQRHLAGFEVISFDPPGTGGSGPVRFPLGMAEMARLAAGVVEVLGRQPVDVLGYSWGGALAQEFAHRFPHLVRRLVLCSSTCGFGGVAGSLEALAALVNPWRPSSPAYLDHVAPRLFGGVAGREPGRFFGADERARSPQAPSPVGYAAQLYAIASWTSLPWLHRLGPPTLVVAGDDDPVVPLANARLLANRIPDCRLHVVAGGGHLILLDQPEVVAPVVREFLLDPDTLAAPRRRAAWEQLTARCRQRLGGPPYDGRPHWRAVYACTPLDGGACWRAPSTCLLYRGEEGLVVVDDKTAATAACSGQAARPGPGGRTSQRSVTSARGTKVSAPLVYSQRL